MRKNKAKLVALSFIAIFCVANSVYTDETIEGHYQKGNLYLGQGKYKEAQGEFQKALELEAQEEKNKAGQPSIEDALKAEEARINLEYKDADLSKILQSLAYSYNLNIVPPAEIKGKVTVSLNNVTVEEALEAVLTSCSYSYYKKGNLIYIYPSAGVESLGLITISLPLKYLTASEAQNLVSKSLSPAGDARVNEVNNSLVIRDYGPALDKIKALLKEIDTPPSQVLIEAKIVEITSKDLQTLGVTYSATYTAPGGLFKHRDSAYEAADIVRDTQDKIGGNITIGGPSTSGLSGGQFKIDTFIMKNWQASATIDALVRDNRIHILASPSIATLNGKEARIIIGDKYPIKEKTQTTTGTTETTKFVDIGTALRVTPQISSDGYITLVVHPEVSEYYSTVEDTGPWLRTTEVDAIIRVKDGETIVIGGLIKNKDERSRDRIPLLGYLPVVGYLFGNKGVKAEQTELAVFITPHIIKETEEAKKAKVFQREESYVNIAGVGGRTLVNTLFEKARKLELNQGIESRRKDEKTRMAEALDLYRTIATQFPESDKADEALYKAGKIYFWFYRDRLKALEMFKALAENYPRSSYWANSNYIVRSIERSQEKRKK